jgi:DivIVA domain-containing protein
VAALTAFGHTRSSVDDDSAEKEGKLVVPKDIRNVSFPGSVRGYERSAVDAYVKRVNRVIAELEVSSSPRAAVRHALEQVGEQTSGILQRAREAAEEITATAHREAEEVTASAKAEAGEIVVNASTESDRARAEASHVVAKAKAEAGEIVAEAKAEADRLLAEAREAVTALREEGEARLRQIHADIATTWAERRDLLDDVRGIASRLEQAASRAAARVPPPEPAEVEEPAEKPTEMLHAHEKIG